MDQYLNFNGKMTRSDHPILLGDNRSFRYGDGVFETMKFTGDEISLKGLHFERFFNGLVLLQFKLPQLPTAAFLEDQILKTYTRNKIHGPARIRLTAFRGNGGLNENMHHAEYLIQAWPLPESNLHLNENGLLIGIYQDAKKSCDAFANLKSNNFLVYVMAALFARQNDLDDCIVLNNYGRICDSTIANVFWIMDDTFYTTPLSEGCVAGVMRKYLLHELTKAGYRVEEVQATEQELLTADEVFLTNAIYGMRWVKQFKDRTFANKTIVSLFNQFINRI